MKNLIKITTSLLVLLIASFNLDMLNNVVSAAEIKSVVTTFYPVYYLAERIGGEVAEVSMLIEGNQDAHDYETSAQDAVAVQLADLFIYQDDEMEYFVPDLLTIIDTEGTLVLESTVGIELLAGEDHTETAHHEEDEHHHEASHNHDSDPHTWLDPMTYAQQAMNVRDALIEIDPENQAIYEENAQTLVAELEALDQEFKTQLSKREEKRIVVQHAAFAYLVNAYDLEQVAITGLSTTQEPSARELAEMQNFVKEQQVSVIYIEPSLDEAIANTVSSTSGAELYPLRTLEMISPEEIAAGADYFSIMRDNLVELMR